MNSSLLNHADLMILREFCDVVSKRVSNIKVFDTTQGTTGTLLNSYSPQLISKSCIHLFILHTVRISACFMSMKSISLHN
jgi:hypothetical protein